MKIITARNGKYQTSLGILALSALALLFVPTAARADIEFQARKMTRGDVPLGKGQCDIRLRVDGEVEVSVRQDRVSVRTIAGRDARDEGSECNEMLPARPIDSLVFDTLDGRGEMILLSRPERQTNFRAVVRIRDGEGGDGRYHFRLSWALDGGGPGRIGGPGARGEDRRIDDGDRPQYDPGQRGRFRMDVQEAVRVCTQAVRAAIDRDYRYSNAEILHARLDSRPGRNDSIIGDAIGRRGANVEEFIFSCGVNFDNGNVRTVDVRRR